MARLTIGMPLYNNERTLSRALESIATQRFTDFVAVLSDDGSNDGTVAIAKATCERDSRFRLVEQSKNLNYGNFRFVLNAADTELFMFAAGDDYWDAAYIERCIALLDREPRAVSCVSQALFFDHIPPRFSKDTFALRGSVPANLSAYFRNAGDNSRMYGVFRTVAAQRAFPATDHHAFDWTFTAATLLSGVQLEVPETLFFRETTPTERYTQYARRDGARAIDRVFPLLAMSYSLIVHKRIPLTLGVVRALLWTNLRAHRDFVAVFHPRYERCTSRILRALLQALHG